MSPPPARHRVPVPSEDARPAPPVPGPGPAGHPGRPGGGRLRRLAARVGAAVRSAHSASVPF
jgi:hypothetical protein